MEDLKALADSFKFLAEPPVPQIDEYLFVRRYLPLFLTREELTPVSGWLEVAKHPFSPVDVVKNGKVLFRVPPLCRQVTLKYDGSHDSVYEILSLAKKKDQISPVMGSNYLNNALNELIIKDPASVEVLRQWNIIFEYYGLDKIELPEPTKDVEVKKQVEEDKTTLLDFEDF